MESASATPIMVICFLAGVICIVVSATLGCVVYQLMTIGKALQPTGNHRKIFQQPITWIVSMWYKWILQSPPPPTSNGIDKDIFISWILVIFFLFVGIVLIIIGIQPFV